MKTIIIVWATLAIAALIGWIMNIAQIYNNGLSDITGMIALKLVGIVIPPLGAILGWIG